MGSISHESHYVRSMTRGGTDDSLFQMEKMASLQIANFIGDDSLFWRLGVRSIYPIMTTSFSMGDFPSGMAKFHFFYLGWRVGGWAGFSFTAEHWHVMRDTHLSRAVLVIVLAASIFVVQSQWVKGA